MVKILLCQLVCAYSFSLVKTRVTEATNEINQSLNEDSTFTEQNRLKPPESLNSKSGFERSSTNFLGILPKLAVNAVLKTTRNITILSFNLNFDRPEFKANIDLSYILVDNINTTKIKNLYISLDNVGEIDLEIEVSQLKLNADFDMNVTIIGRVISSNGLLSVSLTNCLLRMIAFIEYDFNEYSFLLRNESQLTIRCEKIEITFHDEKQSPIVNVLNRAVNTLAIRMINNEPEVIQRIVIDAVNNLLRRGILSQVGNLLTGGPLDIQQ